MPKPALFGLPPVQARGFGAENQVWTAPSFDPTPPGSFQLTRV